MERPGMKIKNAVLLAGALTVVNGCQDYLDVNTNPNAPETVAANLYLSPMLHWMVTTPQYDGRLVGRYVQNFFFPTTGFTTWDQMGYDKSSDLGGEQWKAAYWELGQNLIDMNAKAEAEQRWDLVGVGLLLKAWGWEATTDLHGEIVIKEAFDNTRFSFDYDSQEYAYGEIKRLLDSAIVVLQRTDGAVDATYLAKGDIIYNGDRTKWLKLAYGMLALNLNHYSNKASYKPADVIAAVDKSFTSNADDALETYPNNGNDDTNFLGRTRGNFNSYRQTKFVVELMNGTQFGGAVDPRMTRMLSPAPDGVYRGLDINTSNYGALPASQQPNNFYGYPGAGGLNLPGRYLFDNKAKMPLMTYAQLQFIKAEAAYRMGDKATALAAYKNGISAHIDFVNSRNLDNGQTPTQISASEKTAFLANTNIVPAASGLTLSHIMSQKYIAQWGWGYDETWMDLRRYHYTDTESGIEVFRGFAPPVILYSDNAGKWVQRMRPRYNSEYVWNRAGLDAIHGLDPDYQTIPLWITEP
jgi:hypothetical protein